ncbi:hypothetical protein A9237_21080 [Vibrio owensii]|nr:hypothetical protein A9237_21080 [Vibrio owensii]
MAMTLIKFIPYFVQALILYLTYKLSEFGISALFALIIIIVSSIMTLYYRSNSSTISGSGIFVLATTSFISFGVSALVYFNGLHSLNEATALQSWEGILTSVGALDWYNDFHHSLFYQGESLVDAATPPIGITNEPVSDIFALTVILFLVESACLFVSSKFLRK